MKTQYKEKVVGTTFTNNTLDTFFNQTELHEGKVPTKEFKGFIIPEIENKYDSHAKRVDVKLNNKSIKVGYLGKNGELYNKFKQIKRKRIPCTIIIHGFSYVGNYNDSYELVVE